MADEILDTMVKQVKDLSEKITGSNFVTKEDLDKATSAVTALQKQVNANKAKEQNQDPLFGTQHNQDVYAMHLAKALQLDNSAQSIISEHPESKAFFAKSANLNAEDAGQGNGLLPTAIEPVVSKLVQSYGIARNRCDIRKGVQGNIVMPQRATRAPMAFTGTGGPPITALRADGVVTPQGSTYTNQTLSVKQVSGIVTLEEYLLYQSPIDFVRESAEDLGESEAYLEDSTLFNGDGSAPYGGFTGIKNNGSIQNPVLTATNASAKTTVYLDGLMSLPTLVDSSILSLPDTAFYMHPSSLYLILVSKSTGSGQYVWDPGSAQFKLGGWPVIFCNAMDPYVSTGYTAGQMPAFFGSLKKAVTMGWGREAAIRVLTERYADFNSIGIRLTLDWGMVTRQPKALAKLILT